MPRMSDHRAPATEHTIKLRRARLAEAGKNLPEGEKEKYRWLATLKCVDPLWLLREMEEAAEKPDPRTRVQIPFSDQPRPRATTTPQYPR